MGRSDVINMINQTIQQTGNELDKQATLRQIIEQVFTEKTYRFNFRLLALILCFQYFPFLNLIFTKTDGQNSSIQALIFLALQAIVVILVGYIEIIQLIQGGIVKHFSSWENFNDQLFMWINLLQVVLKIMVMKSGKNVIPDFDNVSQPKEEASLFDTYEIESLKGGGDDGKLNDDMGKAVVEEIGAYREMFIIINVIMLASSSIKVLNIMRMFESIGS